jgi:hypothetical protein
MTNENELRLPEQDNPEPEYKGSPTPDPGRTEKRKGHNWPFLILAGGIILVVLIIFAVALFAPEPANISGDEGSEGPGTQVSTEKKSADPSTKINDAAKFGQTYTYESGLKISVVKVRKVSGGILATIKITNGTEDVYDAEMVSVDASYGVDGKQAQCCITGNIETDESFTGKIIPGRSRTATFSFGVPRSGLSNIVIEITDWEESVAIFQGKAS